MHTEKAMISRSDSAWVYRISALSETVSMCWNSYVCYIRTWIDDVCIHFNAAVTIYSEYKCTFIAQPLYIMDPEQYVIHFWQNIESSISFFFNFEELCCEKSQKILQKHFRNKSFQAMFLKKAVWCELENLKDEPMDHAESCIFNYQRKISCPIQILS